MKKILFVSILLFTGFAVNAQCDKSLLEKAKALLGDEEEYVGEFKIKLKEADINDPAPVAKFYQEMEEGYRYVFRIVNDTVVYNSECIIKLYDDTKLLGINYNVKKNKTYERLDFKVAKTYECKMLATFKDGKAGCAVIMISKVK